MAITIETLQPNADFACAGWLTSVFGFCDGTLWSYIDEGIGSTDALYTQCFNPPIPLAVRYDLTAPTPGLGILQSIRVGIHAAVNSGSDNFTLRVFDGNTQLGGDQIVNVTANFPTGADYYTLPIDVSSLGLTEAHLSDMRVEVETATNPAIIFYVWTLDVELTWDDSPVVLDINLASTDVYGLNRIAQAVTPSADWDIDQVFLDNVWASQPVTCYIHNDSAGQPTGSLIATSDSKAVPSTNPGAPVTFTFPSTVSLSQGVKYWFVFYSPQEDAFTFRNNAAAGSGREIAAYNGATWTVNAFDFAQFKLLGAVVPDFFYDEFDDASIDPEWDIGVGAGSVVEQNDRVEVTANNDNQYDFGQNFTVPVFDIWAKVQFGEDVTTQNGNVILSSLVWDVTNVDIIQLNLIYNGGNDKYELYYIFFKTAVEAGFITTDLGQDFIYVRLRFLPGDSRGRMYYSLTEPVLDTDWTEVIPTTQFPVFVSNNLYYRMRNFNAHSVSRVAWWWNASLWEEGVPLVSAVPISNLRFDFGVKNIRGG